MKNRFCCLVLSVCIGLFALSSTAFAANGYNANDIYSMDSALSQLCSVCNHTGGWSVDYSSAVRYGYSFASYNTHSYTLRLAYSCNMCQARGGFNIDYRTQSFTYNHYITSETDLGHSAGTHLHYRSKHCTYCGDFTISYTCYGPPCVDYMKIQPAPVTE